MGLVGRLLKQRDGLISRATDERDIQPARFAMGPLHGRPLPVAAAKFAEQFAARLETGRSR